MKTLKLTLNKKWFGLVEKGIKTEEYREIKQYWFSRLTALKGTPNEYKLCQILDSYGNIDKALNIYQFPFVEFTNGYSKSSPQITMECKGIEVGTGNVEWGAV